MPLFRKVLTGVVAQRLIAEARKPQNQARIKEMIAKMGEQNKKRGGGAGRGRGAVR